MGLREVVSRGTHMSYGGVDTRVSGESSMPAGAGRSIYMYMYIYIYTETGMSGEGRAAVSVGVWGSVGS